MAQKKDARAAKEAKARLQAYNDRQLKHTSRLERRKRDNVRIAIVTVLVVLIAAGSQTLYWVTTSSNTPTDGPTNSALVPNKALSENRTWMGDLNISGVPLTFALDGAKAPQAVASTVSLVQKGFYNGLTCHRLTTEGIYVLQCGDPQGTGAGGPGYYYGPVENAPANNVYPAGTIAMARQGSNGTSMGSQFFIVYKESTIPADSAGGYTVIGNITSGLPELIAKVVAPGVSGGKTDGAPSVATIIQNITVK